MAERMMTLCDVDDAVGKPVAASARVELRLDGDVRKLDLCPEHLEELRAAVASVLPAQSGPGRRAKPRSQSRRAPSAARKTQGRRTGTSKAAASAGANPLAYSDAVRQWAQGSGLAVKDRGRISQTVIDNYLARTDEPVEASELPAE